MSGEGAPREDTRGVRDYLAGAMNFLGHLYLSGDDPLVITGNFMADAVKGRDLSRFALPVQEGIRLHRRIDSFTDRPRADHAGRAARRAHAGRYAPVVMDLFYDHLLARHWERWHRDTLPDFARRMYGVLNAHAHLMPERTQRMLPYMIAHDWLASYAELDGLGQALHGLSRRVPAGGAMSGAERVMAEHRGDFEDEFNAFLPAIRDHIALPA